MNREKRQRQIHMRNNIKRKRAKQESRKERQTKKRKRERKELFTAIKLLRAEGKINTDGTHYKKQG